MPADYERRRVLVAAGPLAAQRIRDIFNKPPLAGAWRLTQTSSLEHARFVLQHDRCDIILGCDSTKEGFDAMALLAQAPVPPFVALTDHDPAALTRAYQSGAFNCLPREMSLNSPQLVHAALEQASLISANRRRASRCQKKLQKCRRHNERLLGLMWRATRASRQHPWHTQRYALERMYEEVARSKRHGTPLTLAVAEVQPDDIKPPSIVGDWTVEVIAKAKRSSDVAGQYGMNGFLLLMVHTTKSGGVECCRRMKRLLEQPADVDLGPLNAFFGLASVDKDISPQRLLCSAEQHLEAAKVGHDDGVVAD